MIFVLLFVAFPILYIMQQGRASDRRARTKLEERLAQEREAREHLEAELAEERELRERREREA